MRIHAAHGTRPSLPSPRAVTRHRHRAGFIGAGYISLTGNLPGLVSSIASTHPVLLFPFKFAVAYTLLYHYLGAVRHFVWDHHKVGDQADKTSLLELPKVELLSKALFVGAGVLSLIAAFL